MSSSAPWERTSSLSAPRAVQSWGKEPSGLPGRSRKGHQLWWNKDLFQSTGLFQLPGNRKGPGRRTETLTQLSHTRVEARRAVNPNYL